MASSKFPQLRETTDVAQVSWPAGVTPPPEFLSAVDFVRHDEGHLFVTGRAGTGKSTLLRTLRDHIVDEAVVLAPTGLAAVNVGGQTIHSFFGLPAAAHPLRRHQAQPQRPRDAQVEADHHR